jgi:fatty-acyl-CoA synthase
VITPEKPAFFSEERPITYKELNEEANRVGQYLHDKRIKKGDRVSVLLRNCPEFLDVYFAVAKLEIILVPLNFRLVGSELEHQLHNSDTRLLVFHDAVVENINHIRSTINVEKEKYIYLRSYRSGALACPEWAIDYRDLMMGYSTDEPNLDESLSRENPISIIYTSGATGTQKGTILSHLQTYFNCSSNTIFFDMRADDRFIINLPLCHSVGLSIAPQPPSRETLLSTFRKGVLDDHRTEVEDIMMRVMLV